MSRDLLPGSALFHPDARKPEMLGLSGIRHLPTPDHRLAARHEGRVPIKPEILNLSLVNCDYQEAGLDHSQNLLFIYEFV